MRVSWAVINEIETKSKQSYPLEVFGYLLGNKDEINGVVWPRQMRKADECAPLRGEWGKYRGIVGTIHSHPDQDVCLPSQSDLLDDADVYCFGIIGVWKEDNKLQTRIMFWQPLVEIVPDIY